VPSIRDELERRAEVIRVCIDAYEASIRIATDVQLTVANFVRFEPVRSIATTCANLTRDIGAAQLSAVRWFLDL
jgi:hypothetical protein